MTGSNKTVSCTKNTLSQHPPFHSPQPLNPQTYLQSLVFRLFQNITELESIERGIVIKNMQNGVGEMP